MMEPQKLLQIGKQNTEVQPVSPHNFQSTLKSVQNNSSQKKYSRPTNLQIPTNGGAKYTQMNSPLLRGDITNSSIAEDMTSKQGTMKILEEGEGVQAYLKAKNDIDDTIRDLDTKLNRVLAKQEYDYLKGYNIFVKKKEKELRELIGKIGEKNTNVSFKDEKIQNMEQNLHQIREDQFKMERKHGDLREQVKFWKVKAENLEAEKNFLYKQALETKRKNKLLKVALGKLQVELDKAIDDKMTKQKADNEQVKAQFFITDLLQAADSKKNSARLNQSNSNPFDNSHDQSTMQYSLLEPSAQTTKNQLVKVSHRRLQSTSVSRYMNIPTENIKFSKFLELLYRSKMDTDEIQNELKKYVQALETNYNEVIREFKDKNDKLTRQLKAQKAVSVNDVIERSEFESLFVDCIEDTRKEVMKRRLKSEILQRKKMQPSNITSDHEGAKEFEESLLKLANLAKNRIKYSDFTAKDRFNMIDLFVNNEKTLVKIYEALFPHRAGVKFNESTSRGFGNLMNGPSKAGQISHNDNLLEHDLLDSYKPDGVPAIDTQSQTEELMLPNIVNHAAALASGATGIGNSNAKSLRIGGPRQLQ